MWCNFSGSETFGYQPVKIFEPELKKEFNIMRSALNSWFPSKQLDKIELKYQIGKYNLVGPYATSKSIHISETFLSAFWNYCYGLTLSTPLGKTDKGDAHKYYNSYNSLTYCKELFENYKDWDLEKLPNPEFREKNMMGVINTINRIFSVGLSFILIHEFSHIIRGDVFQKNVSKTRYHEMEFASDSYALEVFAGNTDLNEPEILIGLLCATGLLTFCSTFEEQFTQKHPFPDERLSNILEVYIKHTNIGNNNNAWILSNWILVTWDFLRNRIFPGQEGSIFKFSDIKDKNTKLVYEKTLQRLQNKKIWTTQ